jgi:hypothetical protein
MVEVKERTSRLLATSSTPKANNSHLKPDHYHHLVDGI